ncbi:hypothetical protein Q31a_27800 [Aureliella helgolandensis]|uniref:Uncharacterized protein n=1 Tax=Aureliella helgolandensis TaxID=2527968 RepID=A0A518G794_9BACT|nr:hypothetical protein Q31a_27800 [Aureliella helgolandensis]
MPNYTVGASHPPLWLSWGTEQQQGNWWWYSMYRPLSAVVKNALVKKTVDGSISSSGGFCSSVRQPAWNDLHYYGAKRLSCSRRRERGCPVDQCYFSCRCLPFFNHKYA